MTGVFHKSIAIRNIDETLVFYRDILGCKIGRITTTWADINFFGHQLTAQVSPKNVVPVDTAWRSNRFYPVRHFGIVLFKADWNEVKRRVEESEISWLVEPSLFFEGKHHEQESFFIKDPNGYAIEFKTFGEDYDRVFTVN